MNQCCDCELLVCADSRRSRHHLLPIQRTTYVTINVHCGSTADFDWKVNEWLSLVRVWVDEEVANYFSRYQPVFSVWSLLRLTSAIHRGRFRRDNIIHSGRRPVSQRAYTFSIGLGWPAIEQNKFIMNISMMLLDVDYFLLLLTALLWLGTYLYIHMKNAQLLFGIE